MVREGTQKLAVDSSIEKLRALLEKEQQRTVQYSEAEDVANAFIVFYEALASENHDDEE